MLSSTPVPPTKRQLNTLSIESQSTFPPNLIDEPSPVKPTPLPWRQIIILLVVRISEPIAFTILFPFIYFMVKDFNLTDDDKQIGYYVGFIASSFAIAQTITGIPWGMLSDRIGRRPVIIMGLFGTAINLLLFGLSKSLPWAIITRSLCGLLNGNIGVVKSMMAELTDSTNRAQGFSLLPMMFGLGSIIGPMLGGFLSKPVEKYPFFFNKGGLVTNFLQEYPYFLPCGISSFFLLFSAFFGILYLEETLELNTPRLNTEEAPLLAGPSSTTSVTTYHSTSTSSVDPGKSWYRDISKDSWVTIAGYSGLSLQSVMQDELFPIWAASPFIYGGLQFSASDIGIVMAFGGISLLIIQLTLYTKIQRRLGTLTTYRRSFLFYTPVLLMFPLVSSLSSKEMNWLLWPVIILLAGARSGSGVMAFTSINILIAETCPNRRVLGMTNGLAQCSGSLMRAIGPTLCGIIFSWSLSNDYSSPFLKSPFTWIIIALISAINYFISLQITSSQPTI